MSTNGLLSLPADLNNIIFFGLLDEKSRMVFSRVCKPTEQTIYSKILSNLHLPPSTTARTAVMDFNRKYCQYFLRRLPFSFTITSIKTVIEVKAAIDARLQQDIEKPHLAIRDLGINTLLEEAWTRFMQQVDPVQNPFYSLDIRPKDDPHFPNIPVEDINTEVRYFVEAGASHSRLHSDIIGSIISKAPHTCSKETVELLLKRKYQVTTTAMITALNTDKFKESVPMLLISARELNLYDLCQQVKPAHGPIIKEHYLTRTQVFSAYEIRGAMENHYSEDFVEEMLSRCKEDLEAYHVRLGLEAKYSEQFIVKLIAKCKEGFHNYHVGLAIEGKYSAELIKKLLANFAPKYIHEYISSRNISDALAVNYAEDILDRMMEHVHPDCIHEALEQFFEKGSEPDLVEKYLPKTEKNFNPRRFGRFDIVGKYSEALFLKLYHRIDRSQVYMSIDDVITHYSAQTAELLLDNGSEIFDSTLGKALDRQYPEQTLLKILAKIIPGSYPSYVSAEDFEKARSKNYSAAFLEQMKAKMQRTCSIQ